MKVFLFGLMFLFIGITAGLYCRVSRDVNDVRPVSELPPILRASRTEEEVSFNFTGKTPFERQSEVIAYLGSGGALSGSVYNSEPFVTALLAALEATDDPRRALSRLSADGYAENIATQLIFHQWANKNLTDAYQAAINLPPGPRQTSALEATLLQALRHDKAAFAEMVVKHYHKLSPHSIALLSIEDPAELCRIMDILPPGSLYPAESLAVKEWAKSNPEAAWEWAGSRFGSPGTSARIAVAGEWVKKSPEAMDALIDDSSTPSRDKVYLKWFVIEELAKSNPTEALARSMELTETDRQNAMLSLVNGVSDGENPQAAWDFAESIGEPEARNALIGAILSQEAQSNLGNAISWFEAQSDPEMKALALESFGTPWGNEDPETVAEYLTEVSPDFQDADRLRSVLNNVATKLTQDDPLQAAAWAESLPETFQSDALNNVITHWSMADVESAASYLESSDNLPIPDGAVRTVAGMYFLVDAQETLLWVENIASQSLREVAEAEVNQMVLMAVPLPESE